MCGFAGSFDLNASRSHEDLSAIAGAMGNAIRHRGPDEGSDWLDAKAGIILAHRRLSIQDLSAAGRQPMVHGSGRYVLAYNGEIYNASELRQELEAQGPKFKGHSDTEVLLNALACWGVEKTLPRLIGMFAFALWDREEQCLTLVRDRLGVKPLYWGRQGDVIFFASELKSLFHHPDFQARVDRAALSDLVAVNYIPSSQSIYDGIQQVAPGNFIQISSTGDASTVSYWDLVSSYVGANSGQAKMSEMQAEEHMHALLKDAVQRRMVSDVPLGTFLSGGVDSTLVTSLMQAQSTKPVQTFTIGFDDPSFDESCYARDIAHHLGTDHHELILTERDALDVIPKLPGMYCEPFADSSQIPTYLVSHMARRDVTVALSGDGGDEVFAGYNRHLAAHRYWPRMSTLPGPVRRGLGAMLGSIDHATYDAVAGMLPEGKLPSQLGDKVHKFSDMLQSRDLDDFYDRVTRFWDSVHSVVIDGQDALSNRNATRAVGAIGNPVERMQALDMLTYLPGDILTKVDRASMAVGLEVRVPLLDHRVVESAWELPMSAKIRGGETKWMLRKILDDYVPRPLIERPKMGFGVPIGRWLRGPLRDWAEDLLSEAALKETGLFHPGIVRKNWHLHLEGKHDRHYQLWSILMAQGWHRAWMGGSLEGGQLVFNSTLV